MNKQLEETNTKNQVVYIIGSYYPISNRYAEKWFSNFKKTDNFLNAIIKQSTF